MARKAILISILFLFSCSSLLVNYDGTALFELSKVNGKVSRLSCKKKNAEDWREVDELLSDIITISSWRREKFSDEVIKLQSALGSAYKSRNVDFCESMLKIQKERIWQVGTIWGIR